MEDMDWIDLAQERHKWRFFCKRDNEPLCSIKCRKFLDKLRTG
jgi:hypothetical protein